MRWLVFLLFINGFSSAAIAEGVFVRCNECRLTKLSNPTAIGISTVHWTDGEYIVEAGEEINYFFSEVAGTQVQATWTQIDELAAIRSILFPLDDIEDSLPVSEVGVQHGFLRSISIHLDFELSDLQKEQLEMISYAVRIPFRSDEEEGYSLEVEWLGLPRFVGRDKEMFDKVVSRIASECLVGQIGELGDSYREEGDTRFEMREESIYDLLLPDGRILGRVIWFGGITCNGGAYWCAPTACPSTAIISGRAYDFWGGKPELVLFNRSPVILAYIKGDNCNSETQVISRQTPCVLAAAWTPNGLTFTYRRFSNDSQYND